MRLSSKPKEKQENPEIKQREQGILQINCQFLINLFNRF